MQENARASAREVPTINLAHAPGEREAWRRGPLVVYLWALVELIFVSNPFQISSRLRVSALRLFGARIGADVIFRPRTRVKFPWNLDIGDRSWIGEGVWIHNQDRVKIGSDVVISQEAFLTTGSHAHRRDMALITSPMEIEDGVWITSRAMITGGVSVGKSALVKPMTVVAHNIDANAIVAGPDATACGIRFS
ncbi:acetyltransferase [Arthrobacter rhombi]|uniref:acetyltransferase n=1 Tax=Arthrobacter rhombi TaxID=71253 RepID=UPI003FD57F9D